MPRHDHEVFRGLPDRTDAQIAAAAREFRERMTTRRTIRDFSDRPVNAAVIRDCVTAAGQAPSGANMQPWHFEVVGDPQLKGRIRAAAEAEEREFYAGRATEEWLEALAPLGTDADKPFLETAPWLIVIFEQRHGIDAVGERIRYYYTKESVGLAAGFLIAALHTAGLATLTHTPSPMGFLNRILARPANEKPFLLLVVGHPAAGATVPAISRKDPDTYLNFRTEQAAP